MFKNDELKQLGEAKGKLEIENEDLKNQLKELTEASEKNIQENQILHKKSNDLILEINKLDAMLGKYMERLKDADAKIIWFEVETEQMRRKIAELMDKPTEKPE